MIARRFPLHLVVVVLAVAVGALVLLAPRAASAQPAITATTTFDPPKATIGDRVTMSVRVTHPVDVILKAPDPAFKDVDLVTVIPPTTALNAAGGLPVTTFAYTLQPFVLGGLDTGPIKLAWLRADGTTGTIEVAGGKIEITSVRSPNDRELRPLKPQVNIGGAPPVWLRPAVFGGAALAIALLVAAIVIGIRRRRAINVEDAPPVDMSPERLARNALDLIGPPVLSPQFDYESYYGGLALTVRTYLAARFGFNAHALTTRELERRMVSHGVDRWQARLVGGLLERCDDAVYAHRHPEHASADHDLTVAYEIVELSRPTARGEGTAAPA